MAQKTTFLGLIVVALFLMGCPNENELAFTHQYLISNQLGELSKHDDSIKGYIRGIYEMKYELKGLTADATFSFRHDFQTDKGHASLKIECDNLNYEIPFNIDSFLERKTQRGFRLVQNLPIENQPFLRAFVYISGTVNENNEKIFDGIEILIYDASVKNIIGAFSNTKTFEKKHAAQ